jgi:lipopolysaccharide/colanic/teichoic acid biosynthesis glycosyltransferase
VNDDDYGAANLDEIGHLTVVLIILVLLTLCSLIGTIITSPVMGIFALVFLLSSLAVFKQLRSLR